MMIISNIFLIICFVVSLHCLRLQPGNNSTFSAFEHEKSPIINSEHCESGGVAGSIHIDFLVIVARKIRRGDKRGLLRTCAGSLISKALVLTAGSCLRRPNLYVIANYWEGKPDVIKVKYYYTHYLYNPRYSPTKYAQQHDLGMLQLEREVGNVKAMADLKMARMIAKAAPDFGNFEKDVKEAEKTCRFTEGKGTVSHARVWVFGFGDVKIGNNNEAWGERTSRLRPLDWAFLRKQGTSCAYFGLKSQNCDQLFDAVPIGPDNQHGFEEGKQSKGFWEPFACIQNRVQKGVPKPRQASETQGVAYPCRYDVGAPIMCGKFLYGILSYAPCNPKSMSAGARLSFAKHMNWIERVIAKSNEESNISMVKSGCSKLKQAQWVLLSVILKKVILDV